jgi:arylsulfatase A-like enzyme
MPNTWTFRLAGFIDEIEKLGYGDNTLIFYIWGDNGSSAEGQNGTISELLAQNGIPTTVKQHIKALDELGGLDALGSPKTDNQYHAGWAWAGSTPYKGTSAWKALWFCSQWMASSARSSLRW